VESQLATKSPQYRLLPGGLELGLFARTKLANPFTTKAVLVPNALPCGTPYPIHADREPGQ